MAVIFGNFLSVLPQQWVHFAAGILFLVFAILMWRRNSECAEEASCDEKAKASRFFKSVTQAFLTIFIAEWGDLTQLATATLAAKYHAPITIFTSATLALWAVTAIGVIIGCRVKGFINPTFLQRMAASVFAIVGVGFLIHG